MKVIGYELFNVKPRSVFLKIETDEGITGWGEPGLEYKPATSIAAVDEMMDHVMGRDPMQIERHWQRMMKGGFYRGGAVLNSAVSGIDQALWDITGKKLGVPVYQLLGGAVRDRVKVYGHVNGESERDKFGKYPVKADISEILARVRQQMAAGLKVIKFCPTDALAHIDTPTELKNIVSRVEAVRNEVGDDIGIALDFHGRFSLAMARKVFPLLEEFNLLFIEEPVLPEFTHHFGLIARSTSIPIATGERLFSRGEYKDLLRSGIAVAQPDVSHAGGISEMRRIASMAETYDVAMAPHCAIGPIALAASLQVDFATPNFLVQEQIIGAGDPGEVLADLVDYSDLKPKDGYIELMKKPGLGIEVDEKAMRAAAVEFNKSRQPEWIQKDGSYAEW